MEGIRSCKSLKDASERYSSLGIRQFLSDVVCYPHGCKQLVLILNQSYDKFPKSTQSLIFQDVLFAFRQLPQMQTECARKAAIELRQGVMAAAFPRGKKGLAVTEFKHAIIAHKRHCKPPQDLEELPQDVVSRIFTFMDLPSLLSASQVCRSWNAASNDGHLWQSMYNTSLHMSSRVKGKRFHGGLTQMSSSSSSTTLALDWKTIFKQTYYECSWKKLHAAASKGFCKRCHNLIRVAHLGNKTCDWGGLKLRRRHTFHKIKLVSTPKVLRFIQGRGYM